MADMGSLPTGCTWRGGNTTGAYEDMNLKDILTDWARLRGVGNDAHIEDYVNRILRTMAAQNG